MSERDCADAEVKAGIERRLRAVLRALAADPDEQQQAYAPFCAVDEMISDFDLWSGPWLRTYGADGTFLQRARLTAVDAEINALSEAERTCSDPEPLSSAGWAEVLAAARAA